MNTITRNNLIAGLFFPRQWRNWYFVGLGYFILFFYSLSTVPELLGSSDPFSMVDGRPTFFEARMTGWSFVVLLLLLWHFTVGTWRARLVSARQRRHGYAPGEAPIASQLATRAVQASTRVVRTETAPAPVAAPTAAPEPVSAPPVPIVQPAPTVQVPQLVIPTVLGAGRKTQWAEDHGTFTVVDRRRFTLDEL